MGCGALLAVEMSKAKANNETLEYGQNATSPLRTRRYPSENVQSWSYVNNKPKTHQVVDGSEVSVCNASMFEQKRVAAERAASVPTTATVDTNQGKRRKRKTDKVGRIGSVAMPTKSEESDGQVTKA
jgi:hypothetical protein